MRLSSWAFIGLLSSASANSNVTHESRNILPHVFKPPQHFRNINLVRNINLEKSYARETINVVIENVDVEPQREYYLPFEQGAIGRVGGLEVKNKNEPEKGGFIVDMAAIDPFSMTEFYQIILPLPLKPKEQLTLTITYWTLSPLSPLPAQIGQADTQYVFYKFSAYAPSAYTTEKQKTKLKLPTTDVPDAVVLPKELNGEGKQDPQKQGTTYTYGPYGEREPGAIQEVSVRYEFTRPLLHGKLLERDVEVSHWGGNIATEERHWFTNRAASLKNHFSRVKHQETTFYSHSTSALREVKFPLLAGSADAYFIDDIGNVSTSRFRTNFREANLDLRPRYPLFGGWNYNFKVGWNNELKTALRHAKGSSNSYVLKVPFFEGPKLDEGIEYERVITRIILPEGATNVGFETTLPLVSHTLDFHHTFMDTIGRTTLTLTAINVVDELRDRDVVVVYDYPLAARFTKPLTIFAGVLVIFIVSWVIGNVDVSIGKKQKSA